MNCNCESHLYALLTNHCNLACPHCMIKNERDDEVFNKAKFMHVLNNWKGSITLFGGEPTLYLDRFFSAIETNNISSISSNLLILNEDIIEVYRDIPVATSWNLYRFTKEQYNLWMKNLETLNNHNLEGIWVLITITEDLINYDLTEFMKVIKRLDKLNCVEAIKFEQLVDSSKPKEFYEKCDDWLCKIYYLWRKEKIRLINSIEREVCNWNKECANEYTLYPDGKLIRRCPEYLDIKICEECLSCEYSNICTPCRLQQHCTFPKKLYNLIKNNNCREA